jgi:hypothetical protein
MLKGGWQSEPDAPVESVIACCSGDERLKHHPPELSVPATDAILEIWAERGIRNRYTVAGNSMLPVIRDGDIALVEHGTRRIGTGTIILFRRGQSLTAHRVVRCAQPSGDITYYAKGDNASQIDRVSRAGVIGRVLGIERDGRHLWLDTSLWRAAGWLTAIFSFSQQPEYQTPESGAGSGRGSPSRTITRRARWLRLRLSASVPRMALLLGGRWRPGDLQQ